MTNSNSVKMSLEEKLVQHIKTLGLATLIDDEDSITTLTKRAINEAIFQPTRTEITVGWNTKTEIVDSIVVAAAKEIVQKAVKELVHEMLIEILARDDVKNAVREAFATALPLAIHDFSKERIQDLLVQAAADTNNKLYSLISLNNLRMV